MKTSKKPLLACEILSTIFDQKKIDLIINFGL